MTWFLLIAFLVFLGLAVYWLLVWTEGVYLGRRAVLWMYDITAHKYDGIKQFDSDFEARTITHPLLRMLRPLERPLLLDVATGTGRMPALLLNAPAFRGQIIGLDAAARMLAQAQSKLVRLPETRQQQVMLVRQTAEMLPFAEASFDAVTCLEALEFIPAEEVALGEIARVLKPGGFLMTSRRRGWEGRMFFGRFHSAAAFESRLADLGFVNIRSHSWQISYDLVTASKPAYS